MVRRWTKLGIVAATSPVPHSCVCKVPTPLVAEQGKGSYQMHGIEACLVLDAWSHFGITSQNTARLLSIGYNS